MTEYNLMDALGHTTDKIASHYVHLAGRKIRHPSVMDKIKRGK
jgi:hypothetical protein